MTNLQSMLLGVGMAFAVLTTLILTYKWFAKKVRKKELGLVNGLIAGFVSASIIFFVANASVLIPEREAKEKRGGPSGTMMPDRSEQIPLKPSTEKSLEERVKEETERNEEESRESRENFDRLPDAEQAA